MFGRNRDKTSPSAIEISFRKKQENEPANSVDTNPALKMSSSTSGLMRSSVLKSVKSEAGIKKTTPKLDRSIEPASPGFRRYMTSTVKNLPSWKFSSLNFDLMRTKIYKDRKKDTKTLIMEWIAFTLIGLCCGLVTAIMMSIEVFATHEKRLVTDFFIGGETGNLFHGWLFFTGISLALVLCASSATVFYGPGAVGSGNPEIIAYLNGVNYPKLIAFETFVVKIFGVLGAVLGGLCVGKEGLLAHIGANIGAIIPYFPLPRFEFFRNDRSKRDFIAAGVSAGVSTAFGAPIGGALFSYEMSGSNFFWRFECLWKCFYTCSVAVFSVAIFHQLMAGKSALEV